MAFDSRDYNPFASASGPGSTGGYGITNPHAPGNPWNPANPSGETPEHIYTPPVPAYNPGTQAPVATGPDDSGGNNGAGFSGYSSGAFDAGGGPLYSFGAAPTFNPTRFHAPTEAEAAAEPGYQFRLDQGAKALQNSAAAKGVLRTGGTLKDLMGYGQNFAAQEYNNVFDRAMKAYGLNYQGEKDSFDPRFQEWAFLSNAEKARALAEYQQKFDVYSLGANLASQNNIAHQSLLGSLAAQGANAGAGGGT